MLFRSHLNQGLQLTDLYTCIIQNHTFTLTARFFASETLSSIYHHRTHNLQDALWTPIHPFDIKDFTVWKHTKTYLTDLLCRTLHFTSLLNISYNSSALPLSKHVGSSYAIHEKFTTNSKLYAQQTEMLRRLNI